MLVHAPHAASGSRFGAPFARGLRELAKSRPRRVVLLLIAVVAMSLADLDLTITYSTTTGMIETNPIARAIMQGGTVYHLIAWKFATVGLACGLLYAARVHRAAELGAWLSLAVMGWLIIHWLTYNNEVAILTSPQLSAVVEADPRWVVLTPE
jgi:hypothetical protein